MNSLILSLAPLGGLATALPAMAAAECDARAKPILGPQGEARSFAPGEISAPETLEPDRNGGYLLV